MVHNMRKQTSNKNGLTIIVVSTLLWTFSWAVATNVWYETHSMLTYLGLAMTFLRFTTGSFIFLAAVVVQKHKQEHETPKNVEPNMEVRRQAIETMYWVVTFKISTVLIAAWLLGTVYFAGYSTIMVVPVFATVLYAIFSLFQFVYIRHNLVKTQVKNLDSQTPTMCTTAGKEI